MGTEGSHATAHHSPLAAGIVVGDFKSKARDEIPQESKRRESVRPASSELIFQRRSFQEIDVTPACGLQYETRSRWLCCGKLNYPLCGSVWFDLWSFVCACALMHAGCDSRNLCGFGIFCACSRVF